MRIECLPIWDRIEAANLLDPAQRTIVRAEVGSWKALESRSLDAESPDPNMAAAESRLLNWLVRHDLLTEYQSQILKQGYAGPLQIGPLRLVGQVRDWGWPHHYEAVSKRRSTELLSDPSQPQAWVAFGIGLKSSDWLAIWRRATCLAESKSLKSPHLLVPWGSVISAPYCAVLFPPMVSAQARSARAIQAAAFLADGLADVPDGACSMAQRLAPEFASSVAPPSSKRILQWALDVATGLVELHERDLALGYWDPSSVLITANKRAALFALPGIFLRTPFLAGALFSGTVALKDVSSLRHALANGPTQKSTWTPLNFLAPELAERFVQVAEAGKVKDLAAGMRGWATPAADMYCLGSTLAWLFSGSKESNAATIEPHTTATLQSQTLSVPEAVARPIRSLIEKLLSSDPLQRPSASDAIQSLFTLMKERFEPTQKLFTVPLAAKKLRRLCRDWPDRCWTKEVDSIKASEIPGLNKTVEAPHIVVHDSEVHNVGRVSHAAESESVGRVSHAAEFDVPNNVNQTDLVAARAEGMKPDPVAKELANSLSDGREPSRLQRRSKSIWSPPLVACLSSASAALLFLLWWNFAGPEMTDLSRPEVAKEKPAATPSQVVKDVVMTRATGWQQAVIPDDGRLLWESPTVGLPLEVSGLPNNPSGLLVIQRDFWKTGKTVESLLRALEGPTPTGTAEAISKWRSNYQAEQFTRTSIAQYQSLSEVEHVMLFDDAQPVEVSLPGWKMIASLELPTGNVADNPEAKVPADDVVFHYLLARIEGEFSEAAWLQTSGPLAAELTEGLALAQSDQVDEDAFDPTISEVVLDERKLQVRRLLVGPPHLIASAVQDRGETQVAGTMASLLAYSDQDRHLQLFINPVTIWNSQGQDWLGARWQWLGQLVKDRVPTAVRMMALSIHLLESGESYVEVKVIGDRARPAGEVLEPMIAEISKMPEAVSRRMLDMPRVPYWENAMLRYDSMLHDVSGLVRVGQHDRLPTMNVWLRPNALENLIAATEVFFMASRVGGGVAVAQAGPSSSTPDTKTPKDLAELLRSPLSLSIPEQDLINALVELESEIKSSHPELPFEFSIDLDGNSLRLDGITQNQKITNFQQKDRPLAEILTALVLKANPDPAVTDARDPKCKLIWLIDPANPEGRVRVTTRTAAQENGWTLPPELMPEQ